MTATTELEITECWCGIPLALPANLLRTAREHGTALHCPVGNHQFHWESENDKLRKQLDQERARLTSLRDQLEAAERSRAATAGALTKARKRAAAGVCPCCNHSFTQLTRHMRSKHPEFVAEHHPAAKS